MAESVRRHARKAVLIGASAPELADALVKRA
jgi:hypothetical protein